MNELSLFLTHAVALEDESAERYEDLADNMEMHHNPEVAELFRKMAHYSRLHRQEAVGLAERETGGLLDLNPWEFQWQGRESPESGDIDATHYLMTPYHALSLALDAERRARDFYADVAARTTNERVRELAHGFAGEEAEHATILEQWLQRYPPPEPGWDEDPDPPTAAD